MYSETHATTGESSLPVLEHVPNAVLHFELDGNRTVDPSQAIIRKNHSIALLSEMMSDEL